MPLVHHSVEQLPAGSIVVGHDGSQHAAAALNEAVTLAEALHLPVTVLRAFSLSNELRTQDWSGYVPSSDELADSIERALRTDLEPVATAHPELEIGYAVDANTAGKSLVAASEAARYVVVGSRGRGGFAAMLLGSVSEAVVRYASCPVVVTRG